MKTFTNFDQLLETVREEKPEEGFTVVASNPPYQIEIEGNARSAAVYHHFAEVSHVIARYTTFVHPVRWLGAGWGEGLNEFMESEIKSPCYSKFYVYLDGAELFPNVSIKGGLNIYLRDSNKTDPEIDYYYEGSRYSRNTLSDGIDTVCIDPRAGNIIKNKIKTDKGMDIIVGSQRFYGSAVMGPGPAQKAQKESTDEDENRASVYYSDPKFRGVSVAKVDKTLLKADTNDWKVFVLKTVPPLGSINTGGSRGRIFIGKPGTASSDTFLKVGSFKTEVEANNCLLYLKTNFAVFLITAITPSHNSNRKNYKLIPRVNFTTGEIFDKPGMVIDFTKPETLDQQLFKAYGIDALDSAIIDSLVVPWKNKSSVNGD